MSILESVQNISVRSSLATADSLSLPEHQSLILKDSNSLSLVSDMFGERVEVVGRSDGYATLQETHAPPFYGGGVWITITILVLWFIIHNRFKEEMRKAQMSILYPSLLDRVYNTSNIHFRNCVRINFIFTCVLNCLFFARLISSGTIGTPTTYGINVTLFAILSLFAFLMLRLAIPSVFSRFIRYRFYRSISYSQVLFLSGCSSVMVVLYLLIVVFGFIPFIQEILYWVILIMTLLYYIFLFRVFYYKKIYFLRFFMYLCIVEIIPLLLLLWLIT